MIETIQNLEGSINEANNLSGLLDKQVEYVAPTTQEKTATPTKQQQSIEPDEGVFALSRVVVQPIGDEYIIPAGTQEISSNGLYNVKNNEYANVSVSPNLQNKSIAINNNGTTIVQADENYDGLSSVNITTSVGPDLTKYGYSNYTPILDFQIPIMDTIQNNWDPTTTYGYRKFYARNDIIVMPFIDTSKLTFIKELFSDCNMLVEMPVLDFSSVTGSNSHYNCFYGAWRLSPHSINNILYMCSRMNVSSNKKLSYVGVYAANNPFVSNEDIQNMPNYQAFIDAGWTIS